MTIGPAPGTAASSGMGAAAGGGAGAAGGAPNDAGALFLVPGLGLMMRYLPVPALQPGLTLATRTLAGRHPELFQRLEALGQVEIMVDPSDLPLAFVVRLGRAEPEVVAITREEAGSVGPAAVIRGPLETLIALLEGRVDGDAAFFSRALSIEGDTAAVLALRNAIDSAEVNLVEDFCALFGPLAAPMRHSLALVDGVARAAARDLAWGRRLLLGPALDACRHLGGQMSDLAREVEDLRGE